MKTMILLIVSHQNSGGLMAGESLYWTWQHWTMNMTKQESTANVSRASQDTLISNLPPLFLYQTIDNITIFNIWIHLHLSYSLSYLQVTCFGPTTCYWWNCWKHCLPHHCCLGWETTARCSVIEMWNQMTWSIEAFFGQCHKSVEVQYPTLLHCDRNKEDILWHEVRC